MTSSLRTTAAPKPVLPANRPSPARGRRRLVGLAVLVALLSTLAVGCQKATVGARCSGGFAQQGSYVLACRNGRWQRYATGQQMAVFIIRILQAKAGAAGATAGAAGRASTTGFSAPGAALPDDATCAAQVKAAPEVRPANTGANHTKGTQKNLTQPYPLFGRVDGNFTGTTDEIIQWAACKWGFDADVLRAQAAVESWWDQGALWGFQSNPSLCLLGHGIGVDGKPGQCPLGVGLVALTYNLMQNGFPEGERSTAYGLDYYGAWWRSCYTGQVTWLNTVERGTQYGAGDAWGCIGTWNSGRWHTATGDAYVAAVQKDLAQRVWTTAGFLGS